MNTADIVVILHCRRILTWKELKALYMGQIQMSQGNSHVDAVHICQHAVLCAVYMDGIFLMDEVPGLRVDAGGCQPGGLQMRIQTVSYLFQTVALKARAVQAKMLSLGISKSQKNDKLHSRHIRCRFAVHFAHAQPAGSKS